MAAKKRVDGRTRSLVLARALKGQGPSEIARGLGISKQAAYQHLASLRQSGALSGALSQAQERAS